MLDPSLGGEDPLEEELATHASILAQRIPWTEEPGSLQSKGSQRVGLSTHACGSFLEHSVEKDSEIKSGLGAKESSPTLPVVSGECGDMYALHFPSFCGQTLKISKNS